MDNKRESGDVLEHMILDEVSLDKIEYIQPPEEWDPAHHQKEPYVPPILIEERNSETGQGEDRFSLLAHHRSFWKAREKNKFTIRSLVVRSNVHISLAHESIENCIEEALLFDGLLRNGLCENRSRLSEMLGYSRARITQILNLLKLPGDMRRKLLLTDDISEFQLRPIVRVSSVKEQKKMFLHLIKGKLTGRQMAMFTDPGDDGAEEPEEMPDLEELMTQLTSDIDQREPESEEPALKNGVDAHEPEEQEKEQDGIVRPAYVREIIRVLMHRNSKWEEEAHQEGIDGVDLEFLRGVQLLRNGLYPEAVKKLEEVVDQNPDYTPAYYYIGKCENLMGDYQAAENSLRTSLELVPDEPDYMVELAMILEKMKRETEAKTLYRKAGNLRKEILQEEEEE